MLKINGLEAALDFVLAADQNNPAVISFYDRSQSLIKSIGASLNSKGANFMVGYKRYYALEEYDVIISPIITGKDKYFHAIAISKSINKSLVVCRPEDKEISFYNLLMHRFDLPLMERWADKLYEWCKAKSYIYFDESRRLIRGKNSVSSDFTIGYDKIRLDDLMVFTVRMNDAILQNCIQTLLKQKQIWISLKPQSILNFKDMDTYFKEYGKSLVENLEKTIQPLTELNGNIDDFVLKHMRLFPQQAAQVNGVLELLNHSSYAILNEGMGTGKTVQGASICEGYFIRKFLRANPGKTIIDAYQEEGAIKYRNIVMCPGHLVSKWADLISNEIPYSRVTILKDFSQLLEIKKRGIERSSREFYVISKDFAKLSYQKKPIPTKRRYWHIMKKVCKDCDHEVAAAGDTCPDCKTKNIKLVRSGYKDEGMVCPHCNNILLPYKMAKLQPNLEEGEYTAPLDYDSFLNENESNSRCYYCGTELWQPHVANYGDSPRTNTWYRATHYANKTRKNTKTVWVHKKYAKLYFESIGEQPLNERDSDIYRGVRKVAPGAYIKKQLKGFFDFAIFDECHLFKSGSSAQANCMSSIISASKKHLALTGTIAGGMANHIFYLIYRLDPERMRAAGYGWNDEIKFIEKYGVLEKRFEFNDGDEDSNYNSSSKGRQKGSPTVKPGISPLIFMDFLLDKTVFLDLSDMSKYLPPLKEIVDLVSIPSTITAENGDVIENPEKSALLNYQSVIRALKELSRKKNGGRGILSTMLQFSLSYLDKPYGISSIISPKTGDTLVTPRSFPMYNHTDYLLSKEKRLIEIVNREQGEGRNMVIYAEYTGSPETCITHRLKTILEKYCNLEGKVTIIESNHPKAADREEWMHKKAEEGTKVFITNPRNVETGLDFCFMRNGKQYNFPTLYYYQMGYSLFTIWQSSRRHYRLNQREECRTYYSAVKGSAQEAVIGIIAEKMSATSAIQGKFSAEGLTALANGVDAKMKLAQALSNMDDSSGADLQGMFDVINQSEMDDSQYSNYRPMMILSELIGEELANEVSENKISDDEIMDIFSIFDNFINNFDGFNMVEEITEDLSGCYTPPARTVRKKSYAVAGQESLF